MNRDLIADYLSYILFKAFGFVIRRTPKRFGLFLGRRIGSLLYYFDLKHKSLAYSNIKTAFNRELSPCRLSNITREFYRCFVQNLFEIFYVPLVDNEYFKKYVSVEGEGNIAEGFKRGKGIIFLAVHEGSWELANVISSNLGFPFSMFVRDQKKYRKIEDLLNTYRQKKGCKLIQRQNQTRQLIEVLKNNEAVGMTLDQGGKAGTLVKFFGKDASMSSGAVKLALKYDAAVIPVFFTRLNGPYIKLIIEPPFEFKKSGNEYEDIRGNLQRLTVIFEKYIRRYPYEYLWTYKIWKYGRERNILILSDGKTGHLRQSQAAAGVISGYLKDAGFKAVVSEREVKFKKGILQSVLAFASFFSHKYSCQGCLCCLKIFLKKENYKSLINIKPDIIISCGSSLASVNFILSRENLAKSIVIMRPPLLVAGRFDLKIIPEHDRAIRKKNTVVTQGALNLIDEEYLKEQSDKLIRSSLSGKILADIRIGLLIGGDTKKFQVKEETMREVAGQVKAFCEKFKADILITTSRRTSKDAEDLLKKEFKGYSRCKLLIIANENNLDEAVGGILGLSQIVITSPESISMVSEAASSKKYAFIFNSDGLSRKHGRFLESLSEKNYIYLSDPSGLGRRMEEVWIKRPAIEVLNDRLLVKEALKNIL